MHSPFGEFVVNLEAGAFVEPAGRGFDLDVGALAVGFGVEVLDQDGQAVFAVLQDVLKTPSPAGLDAEGNAPDGDGGIEAGFVGGDDLGQGFGFQSSLEQLSYGIDTGTEDVDVLEVHLLALGWRLLFMPLPSVRYRPDLGPRLRNPQRCAAA